MKMKDLKADAFFRALDNLSEAMYSGKELGEVVGTLEEFLTNCDEWEFDEEGEVI